MLPPPKLRVLGSCVSPVSLFLDLWLASELESDLQDAMDWGRKWLVDFNAEKSTGFV